VLKATKLTTLFGTTRYYTWCQFVHFSF